MKKNVLVIVFILVCGAGHPQTTFQKAIGGASNDFAYGVAQTFDGGYIIAGQTVSFGQSSQYYIYLVKTDANGDTLWTRSVGYPTFSADVNGVLQTADSGFIVYGAQGNDMFLLKSTQSGIVSWFKNYHRDDFQQIFSVRQTADGGFVAAGFVEHFSAPSDILLIKTDANGDTAWTRTIDSGIATYDCAYSVCQTSDGGYILTGNTITPQVSAVMFLLKTDMLGNVMWGKISDGYTTGYSVQETTDGGYIVLGTLYTTDNDLCLIKTDGAGDMIWIRRLGGAGQEEGRSVMQTTDEGYIIAANTSSFSSGGSAACMIKTDPFGNVSWTRLYGATHNGSLFSGHQTTDGGYIATGQISGFGSGQIDVYVIRTDTAGATGCYDSTVSVNVSIPSVQINAQPFQTSPGLFVFNTVWQTGFGGTMQTLCMTTGINEAGGESDLHVYPNPAADKIVVRMAGSYGGIMHELTLYNRMGQPCQRIKDCALPAEMNISRLPAGVYMLILDESKSGIRLNQKLVIGE